MYINPSLPNVYKVVTHTITILQHMLQKCNCMCVTILCTFGSKG